MAVVIGAVIAASVLVGMAALLVLLQWAMIHWMVEGDEDPRD
ncbi:MULTISPECIES: hypothetical protein [Cyanophyceae]|nr:hypothetical protein [Nodosilinea sp. FACHB-141]